MYGLLLTEGSLESMRFLGRRESVRWRAKSFVATVQYRLHFTTAHAMWASYASDDWIRKRTRDGWYQTTENLQSSFEA